jgi:hypothetical protein
MPESDIKVMVQHVLVTNNNLSFLIPIVLHLGPTDINIEALLDSGAGGSFINKSYIRTLDVPLILLTDPVQARNVDGTLNRKGTIVFKVEVYVTLNK